MAEQEAVKKVRMLKGTVPEDGVEIARFESWRLFHRKDASTKGWMSLKLVSVRAVPRKGNYWLGWHPKQKRFAVVKDYASLKVHAPVVHAWLLAVVAALPPVRG